MRTRKPVVLALAALASGAALLPASVRHIHRIGGEDVAAQLQADCAVRTSPECAAAIDSASAYAAALLERLAGRTDEDVRPFARQAATSALAPLRAAAAAALAVPFATAEDTPLLLELADDSVPAVRAAALRSLASSNDRRAQLVSRRAHAGDGGGQQSPAESPDAPVAAARVGVPLPADATFLHFASSPGTGRYSYWTSQSPANVIASLRGKGKGPWTTAEFRAQAEDARAGPDLEEGEMPSADDMARAMAMAEQMMKAMESAGAQGGSPEEQAAAMQRAAGGMAVFDANLADAYEDAELFGDARLFVVPVAGTADAVVAVYRDLAVGGTGITVHRVALP